MSDEALRREVLHALRMVAPEMDTLALDPERSFHDQLGIDSIDFLNFVVGLEERLGFRIAERDYFQLSTLQGCLTFLKRRIKPPEGSMPSQSSC